MHTDTKTRIFWLKSIAGVCALGLLLFVIYAEGPQNIFSVPTAYANHAPNCGKLNLICHIDAFYVHTIKTPIIDTIGSIIFTIVWGFVALMWLFILALRTAFWIVYEAATIGSGIVVQLSTELIESAVFPGNRNIAQSLLYNEGLLRDIRIQLWTPVRDLVNVGFALLLIIGSILTVIKGSKDVIAQYGSKFIIAIILVNFSWFIPRVVLDIANVSAKTAFTFARCTNDCYTIEQINLAPFNCVESPDQSANRRVVCPTLTIAITEVVTTTNSARTTMAAILKPYRSILRLRAFPRYGEQWVRLSTFFAFYNVTPNPLPNPQNIQPATFYNEDPYYPPNWIGIGNIIVCVWKECANSPTDGPSPISGALFIPPNNGTLRLNTPNAFLHVTSLFFLQIGVSLLRFAILTLISTVLLIIYTFAVIALLAMVLLRIPIIWLTLGFMPVIALGFVIGKGGPFGIGGLMQGVWDKFVGAAFIPAAIGIPLVAGSLVLDLAQTTPPNLPAIGILALLFPTNGLLQILFIIIAIMIIWLGVFAAIGTLSFAGNIQKTIADGIGKTGMGAAGTAGIGIANMPLLPIGAMGKVARLGIGGAMAGTGKLISGIAATPQMIRNRFGRKGPGTGGATSAGTTGPKPPSPSSRGIPNLRSTSPLPQATSQQVAADMSQTHTPAHTARLRIEGWLQQMQNEADPGKRREIFESIRRKLQQQNLKVDTDQELHSVLQDLNSHLLTPMSPPIPSVEDLGTYGYAAKESPPATAAPATPVTGPEIYGFADEKNSKLTNEDLQPDNLRKLTGRNVDIEGEKARIEGVSDDGKKVSLIGAGGTKYEAAPDALKDAILLPEEEKGKVAPVPGVTPEPTGTGAAPASAAKPPITTPATPAAGAMPTETTPAAQATSNIGEEVRKGAREGVIEGMTGKPPAEAAAAKTGWFKPGWFGLGKFGADLTEQGGKIMQRGVVGHVVETGKEWWEQFQGTKIGQKMGKIATGTRNAIKSLDLEDLLGASKLQKALVGGLVKAASGQLEAALHDAASGHMSLAEAFKRRFGATTPPTPKNMDAAASKLAADPAAQGTIKNLIYAIQAGTLTQKQIRNKIEDLKRALQPHGIDTSKDDDLIQAIRGISDLLRNKHGIADGLDVQAAFEQNVRNPQQNP